MLVATDVAARGIDVNDLTHVINYALPQETDIYTHRIGRTGRAGKKGVAISIFSPSEGKRFAAIRKATNNALELRSLPDAKAIINAKKLRFREALEERLPKVNKVYWQMAEELSEVFDPLAVMAAMLDMKFYKELLPENYPPLSKGRHERQFGSMHGTHRENTRDNDRRTRRRRNRNGEENPESPENNTHAEKRDRSGKKFRSEKEKSFEKREHSGDGKKAFSKEKSASAEKPRKRLREWAMDLAEMPKDLPRYKIKKRK